jgi:hypothetical protein
MQPINDMDMFWVKAIGYYEKLKYMINNLTQPHYPILQDGQDWSQDDTWPML